MIVIPECCRILCDPISVSPYMFKCKKCGKELPAKLVISGRTEEEEMCLYKKWAAAKTGQWDG